MDQSPEACFLRYRARGDADGLARVFDLTAGKLLLIAMHVARDRADAEDLVQGTFLAAIESAAKWDARQPLLPWLVGILSNRARMQSRRARQAPSPEHRDDVAPDPLEHLAALEVTAEVSRAVDALPDAYREVLILRLVHGLRSVQIAHALTRSPETVRTQVRRGLELLRQRLPKGLAAPLAVALASGESLAALRARARARERAALWRQARRAHRTPAHEEGADRRVRRAAARARLVVGCDAARCRVPERRARGGRRGLPPCAA